MLCMGHLKILKCKNHIGMYCHNTFGHLKLKIFKNVLNVLNSRSTPIIFKSPFYTYLRAILHYQSDRPISKQSSDIKAILQHRSDTAMSKQHQKQ